MPTTYIGKSFFHVRIKEHSKARNVINKSNVRTPKPFEHINIEPNIAMVKDLLVDNIDGPVIYLCGEAAKLQNQLEMNRMC